MAFTHKVGLSWTNGSRTIAPNKSYTADLQVSVDVEVADSETDFEVVVAIDVSALQNIYITSDQDVTLETNDGGAPTDTINLKADTPYIWNAQLANYYTNKLTTDVTALFITNASGAAARLQLEAVVDPTP